MLLQTNSYVVPKDKRTEHARLVKRFRQVMARLGLTDFEVYEQAGANWSTEVGGRFVQIMRFRDREHQQAVHAAEQTDAGAQDLVREFCDLVNFHYQHQQGIATTAFYLGINATAAGGGQKRLPDTSVESQSTPLNGSSHESSTLGTLMHGPSAHEQSADEIADDVEDAVRDEPFPKGPPARIAAEHDD